MWTASRWGSTATGAIEEFAEASGLPVTLQRATQFHSLLDRLFRAQRLLPVVVAPRCRFQPIAVAEVAARMAELASGEPRGRVDDIGGPAQRTVEDLYAAWRKATGGRRRALGVRLPGGVFAALEAGHNMVPGTPYGTGTFEEYLAAAHR